MLGRYHISEDCEYDCNLQLVLLLFEALHAATIAMHISHQILLRFHTKFLFKEFFFLYSWFNLQQECDL